MDKAPDAYRTISEVGEDLDIAQHVLRFWETRFPQIKPLKRGGGRRYYRPDDVELLKGIRHLLYREGYTIKGVQRILKEQGVKAVQAVGRAGGLVPGLGPASPDDAYEDFAPAPPVAAEWARPPDPAPVAASPTPMAHPMPPASAPASSLFELPLAAPTPSSSLPSRIEEGQVSFTRGGIGARPAPLPADFAGESPAASLPVAPPPVPGSAARKALLDALNELESARAAIGQVLASRDRLSSD